MLSREEVFEVINTERAYQDATYSATEMLTSGITRQQRDVDVTAHLVLLDRYIDKAKTAWLAKGDNTAALKQVAKIAAIAVRALERAGGSAAVKAGLR